MTQGDISMLVWNLAVRIPSTYFKMPKHSLKVVSGVGQAFLIQFMSSVLIDSFDNLTFY